jgi:hypothetical protein
MCSTSRIVPVRRSGGIAAARAMLGDRTDITVAPPVTCRNRRRLIGFVMPHSLIR